MIINVDLTKVVKFSLLIYFEKSKSDIIEWHKTSKSDCSSSVYRKLFVFFKHSDCPKSRYHFLRLS